MSKITVQSENDVLLSSAQLIAVKKSNSTSLLQAIKSLPFAIDLLKGLDFTKTLRLVIPIEVEKAILDGTLKLVKCKSGAGFLPTLQDLDGNFAKQLTLDVKTLIAFPELLNTIEKIVVQQQLAQIIRTLEIIDFGIDKALVGQHNDRIALAHSSQQMLLQANEIVDPQFKLLLYTNIIKTANDAQTMLCETMYADIKNIMNDKIKGKKVEASVQQIKWSIQAIQKTTSICANVYFQLGESAAMQVSIDNYIKLVSAFDKQIFDKLDSNDLEGKGFWRTFQEDTILALEAAKKPAASEMCIDIPADELSIIKEI